MGKQVQLNRDQRRRQKGAAALEERARDVVLEEAEEEERDEGDGRVQDDEAGELLVPTPPAELECARDEDEEQDGELEGERLAARHRVGHGAGGVELDGEPPRYPVPQQQVDGGQQRQR